MKRIVLPRRRRDEAGATAVLVAMFFSFIALPLGAVSVDVARLYVELERVQAAADAAATAGVTYMPDDFAAAKARAIEIAGDNGFPNSGSTSVVVTAGEKPTQLKVTVSSTVDNSFARTFGMSQSTMSRSAVADFNGPAPMGSPCNTFGNEPAGTAQRPQIGSGLVEPDVYADCSSRPMFWASAAGPNVVKTQGDQFGTRYCGASEARCTGRANDDFDPNGYFYLVRVAPAAVGSNITLQVFDPAYVSTESRCTSVSVPSSNNWNDYTTADAKSRYANTPNDWCTGDNDNSDSGQRQGPSGVMTSHVPTVTSFGLRAPVDTLQPIQAPPVAGCAKQYPGYGASGTSVTFPNANSFKKGDGSYDDKLARVFHHWVTLCTFTPDKAGDYYLQVRTNVPLSTASYDNNGGYNNTAVFTQAGDNLSALGTGTNRFGLRALTGAAGAVSVSAYDRMPIFANSDSADTTFNLVRVIPAAASKTLVFSFFDVGEASSALGGTLKVVPPADAVGISTNIAGCTGEGKLKGNLTDCQISGISSAAGWDGQYQEIRVPIPSSYSCKSAFAGGCWFQVKVSFPGSTVTDATTWTARIAGEPVRLIE